MGELRVKSFCEHFTLLKIWLLAVGLGRAGWNKRSGSTKSAVPGSGVFVAEVFCQWSCAQRQFVVPYRLLVEPLRLFHPTVVRGVKYSVVLALNSHSC